jgi:hypothetical protein
MSEEKGASIDGFNEDNAKALTEILVDPATPESVRLQIINELNEAEKSNSFFETMFNELLTLGACPNCCHENHWLVPEDDLSQMGWVTPDKDKRVPKHTDKHSCPTYQEACSKKKTAV